jgi:hypothetical protein
MITGLRGPYSSELWLRWHKVKARSQAELTGGRAITGVSGHNSRDGTIVLASVHMNGPEPSSPFDAAESRGSGLSRDARRSKDPPLRERL